MKEELLHLPPQSLRAEEAVLGAMMISPESASLAASRLKPVDFVRPDHRAIFQALSALTWEGRACDLLCAEAALEAGGKLAEVGGRPKLLAIVNGESMPAFCEHYLQLVEEASGRRQLLEASAQSIRECYDEDEPFEALMQRAQERLFRIAQRGKRIEWHAIGELAAREQERVFRAMEDPGAALGLPTGLSGLDRRIGGMKPSQLLIIGARSSMGKTALGICMTAAAAAAGKGSAAVFSLEMSKDDLTRRFLASEARIDLPRLESGALRPEGFAGRSELTNLARATEILDRLPVRVCEESGLTPMKIRAQARQFAAQDQLACIMVDYAQIVRPDRPLPTMHAQMMEVAVSMKEMARELSVPVMLLSQLSREPERRDNRRPRLSDLRESSALESEADVVLLLYRPRYYEEKPEGEVMPLIEDVEIKIAKQRNGPTGTFTASFLGPYARFEDREERFGEGTWMPGGE